MSSDAPITRESLNGYLRELAKEYRKLSGKGTPAEIILIGGAAVLVNYGFREMTYDIDAVIIASSAFKEASNRVGDRHGLPNGWLNTDFKHTKSYSDKLFEVSTYYKTYSNILTVRIVAAEYLIAMKLVSGRRYKNDLSDITGILWEHQKIGQAISYDAIEKAITVLYGSTSSIPEASLRFIKDVFKSGDYEALYKNSRESEIQAKEILLDFEREYPGALTEQNTDTVLEIAKRKLQAGPQPENK